jgi:hypothetical protein
VSTAVVVHNLTHFPSKEPVEYRMAIFTGSVVGTLWGVDLALTFTFHLTFEGSFFRSVVQNSRSEKDFLRVSMHDITMRSIGALPYMVTECVRYAPTPFHRINTLVGASSSPPPG